MKYPFRYFPGAQMQTVLSRVKYGDNMQRALLMNINPKSDLVKNKYINIE